MLLTFRVIGCDEFTNEKFDEVIKVNKNTFRDEYKLPATLENVRRQLVCNYLENRKVVSKITVLALNKN